MAIDPYNPSIPSRGDSTQTDARRVSAHSENTKNDLKPVSRSMSIGSVGKLGIRGNGQQK